ncbi:MAG: hypothetical protein ABWX88_10760 [Pseudoxanthomonas sp.]
MKSYFPEPLTPEERELALLTGHLGPHGEPSSALDAKILAAAHAALDRKQPPRRKPRWPVTMGLAASVLLAVGIAWQLRPLQQLPMPAEAPAEVAEQEAVADRAAMVQSLPQPLPEAEMAVQAQDQAAASAAPAAPAAPGQAMPAPAPSAEILAAPSQSIARPTPQTATSARSTEASRRQERAAGKIVAAEPPPPPSPAPAVMSASPAPAPQAPPSFAPDPRDGSGYSARAAAADSSSAGAGVMATKSQADAAPAESKSARANASARQKEVDTLDRVEISSSRLKRTDLQVPVSDDAELPVGEWLERVRTRYGLGDADAAKQSLLLFVKDHPGEPVPGDLEPLLEE